MLAYSHLFPVSKLAEYIATGPRNRQMMKLPIQILHKQTPHSRIGYTDIQRDLYDHKENKKYIIIIHLALRSQTGSGPAHITLVTGQAIPDDRIF